MKNPATVGGADLLGGDHPPQRENRASAQRLPGRLTLRFGEPGPILTRHYLRPTDMEARHDGV